MRQLRLRDVGGMVVIDFIDMVLESNRELVLRRLTECLGRDRTKHQVAEVTSLGLVQMTRKRVGEGLLEAFSETCQACNGRGVIMHSEPIEIGRTEDPADEARQPRNQSRKRGDGDTKEAEEADSAVELERRLAAASAMAAIHRAANEEGEGLSDALAKAASALEDSSLIPGASAARVDEQAQTSRLRVDRFDQPMFSRRREAPHEL